MKAKKAIGITLMAFCFALFCWIALEVIRERSQANRLYQLEAAALPLPSVQPMPLSGNPKGMNINTATKDQLMTLPGINSALADAIIAQRGIQPFHFLEDLRIIKGIGEKRVEALREVAYTGVAKEE